MNDLPPGPSPAQETPCPPGRPAYWVALGVIGCYLVGLSYWLWDKATGPRVFRDPNFDNLVMNVTALVIFVLVMNSLMSGAAFFRWLNHEFAARIGSRLSSRLSLRTLFILMTVFALGCWWLAIPGRAFDANAWNEPRPGQHSARQQMADRFVARESLQGMKRDEVIGLLGQPEKTRQRNFAGNLWSLESSPEQLIYYLGPERGFMGMEHEWLTIELDDHGRVVRVHIVCE
jgi:hypothetical protein